MNSARSTGRTVGILMVLQMAAGLILPFILIRPMTSDVHGFLENAAGTFPQVRAGVLVAFVGGALTLGIAIAAWPVVRRRSETMALWLLVLCAASLIMDAVHNASVMTVLSLSKEYVKAGASAASLQPVGATVAAIRYWAHYTQLIFVGAWIAAFYSLLLRFALIPRVLAVLGLIGIALQITGVTMSAFLGYPSVVQMAMPLAPIHLAVAAWLIVKGFDEPHLLQSGLADVAPSLISR